MVDNIDRSREIVDEIGHRLIDTFEQTPGGLLLYADITDYMIGTAYFVDHGDYLQYHENYIDTFGDLLMDLRNMQPAGKRWSEIEYRLVGAKVGVKFSYPEDLDDDEPEWERRDRIVASYFGDKPTRYPKLGNDSWVL